MAVTGTTVLGTTRSTDVMTHGEQCDKARPRGHWFNTCSLASNPAPAEPACGQVELFVTGNGQDRWRGVRQAARGVAQINGQH